MYELFLGIYKTPARFVYASAPDFREICVVLFAFNFGMNSQPDHASDRIDENARGFVRLGCRQWSYAFGQKFVVFPVIKTGTGIQRRSPLLTVLTSCLFFRCIRIGLKLDKFR